MTAALSLAAKGWRVDVFEQASVLEEVGAGVQISPNASRVLHSLGLGGGLQAVAAVPAQADVKHWRSGATIAAAPLNDRTGDRAPYYHLHRADLQALLRDAAADAGARLHLGFVAADVRDDSESVALLLSRDRSEAIPRERPPRGAVLIGADGIHSIVRQRCFGTEDAAFSGCVAWRALVPSAALPDSLAARIAAGVTVWWGPGRHFVCYAVRGGTLVNCVAVVATNAPWPAESWSARGDPAKLQREFDGWNTDVAQLVAAMPPDACYAWALFHRPSPKRWSTGRVALLGDACHPVLPFLAQGAALAIEDAAVLAGCLGDAENAEAGLRRYGALRRKRARRVQAASRRNAGIFHMRGIGAWCRDRIAPWVLRPAMDAVFRYDALTASSRP